MNTITRFTLEFSRKLDCSRVIEPLRSFPTAYVTVRNHYANFALAWLKNIKPVCVSMICKHLNKLTKKPLFLKDFFVKKLYES